MFLYCGTFLFFCPRSERMSSMMSFVLLYLYIVIKQTLMDLLLACHLFISLMLSSRSQDLLMASRQRWCYQCFRLISRKILTILTTASNTNQHPPPIPPPPYYLNIVLFFVFYFSFCLSLWQGGPGSVKLDVILKSNSSDKVITSSLTCQLLSALPFYAHMRAHLHRHKALFFCSLLVHSVNTAAWCG